MTLMTLTVLHTNAEEFQKSKGLQFNIPKCKILTILSLLKSCNICELTQKDKHIQIAGTVTILGKSLIQKKTIHHWFNASKVKAMHHFQKLSL